MKRLQQNLVAPCLRSFAPINQQQLRSRIPNEVSLFHASRQFSSANQPKEEEDIVKTILLNQQKKIRAFFQELMKVRIVIDPEDPKVVKDYAQNMANIRKKVGIPSDGEKLQALFNDAWEDSPTVRRYYEIVHNLRARYKVEDDTGADKLMLEAIDKVEKKIGKPLTKNDAKGMRLFHAESNAVLKQLGYDHKLLAKYEQEYELNVAKSQLGEMKDAALTTIEKYKERDGLQNVQVDLRELEPRNYL